jgi:hypothetical protein
LQPLVYARALYDYAPHYDEDISLKTHDRLVILHRPASLGVSPLPSADWHYVESIRTRQRGFVPAAYVQAEASIDIAPG